MYVLKYLFSNKEKYVLEQSTPFKLILLQMNLPASGREWGCEPTSIIHPCRLMRTVQESPGYRPNLSLTRTG